MLKLRHASRQSPVRPRPYRSQKVRLATAIVLLIAPLGAAALAAQPAVADPPPPCYGPSCVHKDPQATGCAGSFATSLAEVWPPGGGPGVILRWSDWCHANWARFDGGTSYSPAYWNYWVQTYDGHREYQIGTNGYWTWMVNGVELARACIQGASTSQYNCTRWY